MDLLNIPIEDANGKKISLAQFKGKALLLVNVASKCGLTPQYKDLQELYVGYRDQGLMIIGFPTNDFAGQEPGSNTEIQEFCSLTYGVEFPVMGKIQVKEPNRHPLYRSLIAAMPTSVHDKDSNLQKKLAEYGLSAEKPEDIQWNFEKFLIDRDGKAVARFAPDIMPDDPRLTQEVERLLA